MEVHETPFVEDCCIAIPGLYDASCQSLEGPAWIQLRQRTHHGHIGLF